MEIDSARAVVMLLSLMAASAWLIVYISGKPRHRARAVLLVPAAGHAFVFTYVASLHVLPATALNLWSTIVRAHCLLCLLILAGEHWADRR